jgi:hypothetical protein
VLLQLIMTAALSGMPGLPGRRRVTAYDGSGTVHVGAPVGRCGVTHFATQASVITDCRRTRYESQAERLDLSQHAFTRPPSSAVVWLSPGLTWA